MSNRRVQGRLRSAAMTTAGAVIVLALLLGSCGGGGDRRVVVLAASSLTGVFGRLETEYESEHPGVDVVVSFGASSALAGQIDQGAPADVFASADTRTMDRVSGGDARTPRVFARNRLAIAVEPGNPLGIRGLTDLARDDLVVVLADADVPAGAYAAQVLEAAGVVVQAASYEANVKAVASKVALGEADAGIVYRTDIAADPSALGEVDIPDDQNIVADYPIVGLTDREDVASFVEFVLSSSGRAALTDAGFDAP